MHAYACTANYRSRSKRTWRSVAAAATEFITNTRLQHRNGPCGLADAVDQAPAQLVGEPARIDIEAVSSGRGFIVWQEGDGTSGELTGSIAYPGDLGRCWGFRGSA